MRLATDKLQQELSEEQYRAVMHPGGPLLVLAGAGSGKTRTLVYRTAWHLCDGVKPDEILVSTFTNRATNEFKDRLHKLIGQDADRLWMGTLHGIGSKILRDHGTDLGYKPNPWVADTRKSYGILYKACAACGFFREQISMSIAMERITKWKETLITPDMAMQSLNSQTYVSFEDEAIAKVYAAYQRLLKGANGMDFGDLVMQSVELLKGNRLIRERLRRRKILVDEFQDTDPAQWAMLQLLMDPVTRDSTFVGDIDQAIYRFRGADPRIMRGFQQHFPGGTIISLGQNYRSTKTIVAAAAAVIEKNTDRIHHRLFSRRPDGVPIVIRPCKDDIAEANLVTNLVQELNGPEYGIPYREMAILYRTNYQSEPLEARMLAAKVPYHVVGHRFFDRQEVKDVLAFLRVLHAPDDPLALEEALARPKRKLPEDVWKQLQANRRVTGENAWQALIGCRGLDTRNVNKVTKFVQLITQLTDRLDMQGLTDLYDQVLMETGIKEHWEKKDTDQAGATGTSPMANLTRLRQIIDTQFNGPALEVLPEFLEYAAIMSQDDPGSAADAVQLMTVHAAKGTEFQVVLVVGAEEKLIPHSRALNDPEDPDAALEEERRLFYVAMTRAKNVLQICYCQNRANSQGRTFPCAPTRFLGDIPGNLKVFVEPERVSI